MKKKCLVYIIHDILCLLALLVYTLFNDENLFSHKFAKWTIRKKISARLQLYKQARTCTSEEKRDTRDKTFSSIHQVLCPDESKMTLKISV